jgi:hypothetical protein
MMAAVGREEWKERRGRVMGGREVLGKEGRKDGREGETNRGREEGRKEGRKEHSRRE